MKEVVFSVGAVTFTYSLNEEQQRFLRLAEETHINLNEWKDFSDKLSDTIQDAIPDELKLPSQKQLDYVRAIAKDLNLELPNNYEDSALTCLSFIADHKPAHDRVLSVVKGIKGSLLG